MPDSSRLDVVNLVVTPDAPARAQLSTDISRTESAVGQSELKPAWCFLAAPVAVGLAIVGLVVAGGDDGPTPTQVIGTVLVGLWAAAGVLLGLRRRQDRLGPIVLAGAVAGGALCLAQSLDAHAEFEGSTNDAAAIAVRLLACLLPAFALHMFVALPDGRLLSSARQRGVICGYVIALGIGTALCSDLDEVMWWPIVALWISALGFGVYATFLRYRTAGAVERRRIQWIGWGLTVAAEAVLVVIALRLLTDWPNSPGAVSLAMTGLIPIAIIAGTLPKMVARVDRLLTHTVALAGLTALILGIYVVVVLGSRAHPGGRRTDAAAAVDGRRRPRRVAVPAGTATG